MQNSNKMGVPYHLKKKTTLRQHAKEITLWQCTCGYTNSQWCGRCPMCGCFDTFQEITKEKNVQLTRVESDLKTQNELFLHIYNTRSHISELSGKSLAEYTPEHKDFHWCFHHILPKKVYKMAELSEENILYLLPEEHYAIHNFSNKAKEEMNCDWVGYSKRKAILLEKFNK